jgi:peptide deformylase
MIILRKDKLELVSPDHPLLKRPPALYDFKENGDSAEQVGNVLFEKMASLGGIGLSANQLGLDMMLFVMGTGYKRMFIFNPEILEYSKEEISFKEGCLSYPGIFMEVKRPKQILARWQEHTGELVQQWLDGVTARVFQHEFDHMRGTDFTHRASKLKLDMAKKKYENKKRKFIRKHAIDTMVKALKEKEDELV